MTAAASAQPHRCLIRSGGDQARRLSSRGARKRDEAISATKSCASEEGLLRCARNDNEAQSKIVKKDLSTSQVTEYPAPSALSSQSYSSFGESGFWMVSAPLGPPCCRQSLALAAGRTSGRRSAPNCRRMRNHGAFFSPSIA